MAEDFAGPPKYCDEVLDLPPLDPRIPDAPGAVADTTSSECGTYAKRNHQRLSNEAVKVLRSWLQCHRTYPYPTKEEKDTFQQQTGLSRAQISDWFSNARRRNLVGIAPPAARKLTATVDPSLQSPLERWKNSPPGSEAATTSDIMRALRTIRDPGDNDKHTASSASHTINCSHSWGSELSFGQHMHHQPTERQRIEQRCYQCTFCTDSFSTKYDWERHEKTLHLPVDVLICAPDGGITSLEGVPTCVFCRTANPDDGVAKRACSRKDYLRQHLKLSQYAEYHSGLMDGWRASRTPHIVSRCGLCDAAFTSWKERVDHVVAHFKNGADMAEWRGNWGFETDVQHLRGALVAYIRSQTAVGVFPSDEMLQQKARQFSYGGDDLWDQTYADYHPLWLETVKQEAEIQDLMKGSIYRAKTIPP
ncbi:uncharacterized protein BO97DRAFT_467618 [Aspergillus homomorphus CBS 101889]|uniref:Homeobox and C2H2 transcription factor n=1 Tax=Aspergillus homomorphus (strain CBS 101889) TaxID=1450537 RepID=A0A395I7Z9_ASPHC|nr:hypothetical protein BO97DRAFT_467618 [Aspergillus homomorphus CBS 101889]RAL16221.1 hypothetical protein BO97DRAFT_467618 [Aspergillus homomorphus CBS 101889]